MLPSNGLARSTDDDADLLRLMGYRIGASALGYTDEVRNPIGALRRGATGAMSFGEVPR